MGYHSGMRLRQVPQSIITRILLLGLTIVLVGTVVRYFVVTAVLREDLAQVVGTQQQALASYVAQDVDGKILRRQDFLQRLGATLPPALLARPEQLRAWLQERYQLNPLFSFGLLVIDQRGRVLADYPRRSPQAGLDLRGRDFAQVALAGAAVVGQPVLDWVEGDPMLPLAVPLKDSRGVTVGALLGLVPLSDPGFLSPLLQSAIGRSGGFLVVSPRDRLIVAATDPALMLQPVPPPGADRLHDRAMDGFRGSGITVNAEGVEESVAIVAVPSVDWFVAARLPTAEAFAPVARMRGYILRNSVVVSIAFLVLAALGLYYLFRPLLRAAQQAERMSRGEIPLAPLTVVRGDEVGHLTAAFNRLLERLGSSQEALSRAAHHDVLTGLPNRSLLSDRLHQALAVARRNGTRLALLFLDLDGFKPINDRFGHDAGDGVLRQVAVRLERCVRESDTLARLGGDEFVIVLGGLDGQAGEAAAAVAVKCLEALVEPFTVQEERCPLSVSVGIALGNGESSAKNLLLEADRAMYRAKESGRGRYVLVQA